MNIVSYSILILNFSQTLNFADEYGFEVLDLREEFEAIDGFESKFLRPNNDNVHFTKEGAQYVANRVWEIAKDLTF